MNIPKCIKQHRKQAAYRQSDVAKRAGMHQGDLSRFERGLTDIYLSTLQKLAHALDLEVILVPKAHAATFGTLLSVGESKGTGALSPLERYGISDDED